MIIDVTGFGWSGSGAVVDILKEYENLEFPEISGWEFNLIHCVDGLYDLDCKLNHKHCRFFDSNIAIKRFLHLAMEYEKGDIYSYRKIFKGEFYRWCEEYIESLTDLKFSAKSAFDRIYFPPNPFIKWIGEKLLGYGKLKWFGRRLVNFCINRNKYFAYNVEDFDGKTRIFIDKIVSALRNDPHKPLVMDHMFSPDCPHLFFKYIGEDVRCIVVRRDPRDTYLLAKHVYKGRIPLPIDKVEDFITFYKKSIYETKIADSSEILNLNFEDLIYNYDDTINKIEVFTGVSKHVMRKIFFNPSVSVNNTRLFEKYQMFREDIKKIEDALPKALYNFDNCKDVLSVTDKVF